MQQNLLSELPFDIITIIIPTFSDYHTKEARKEGDFKFPPFKHKSNSFHYNPGKGSLKKECFLRNFISFYKAMLLNQNKNWKSRKGSFPQTASKSSLARSSQPGLFNLLYWEFPQPAAAFT